MLKYQHYNVEEFLNDDHFRTWVLQPNSDVCSFWEQFLTAYPSQQANVEEAFVILKGAKGYFEEAHFSNASLEHLLQNMLLPTPQKNATISSLFTVKKIAVAIFILAFGAFGFYFWQARSQKWMTYQTNFGEWQTITLPDSSVVVLNANSLLKTAKEWKTDAVRQVWLEGEAYFKVKPHLTQTASSLNFQVITDDLVVEVLGTAFNVHSRTEKTKVYLEEGSVQLNLLNDKEPVALAPGEIFSYDKNSAISKTKQHASTETTSWKDGVLMIKDKPLKEVLARMEEIYGVKFIVTDTLLYQKQITANVPMKQFDITHPILEKVTGLTITQKNGYYTLTD
jgi:ferric-dicitrate binding protein FerR (iron transport regulator)